MASGSYLQVEVGCPFYLSDDGKRRVICEGPVDKSSLTLRFRRREDFQLHTREFCCKRYICCELYRMLMEKYP